MNKLLFTLIVFLTQLLCVVSHVSAYAKAPSEYAVKAAFLFNFTKFIEWSSDQSNKEDSLLQICVIGKNPFNKELENIFEGKKVEGKSIKVSYAKSVEEALLCDVAFIAKSEENALDRILKVLAKSAILTVSDIDDFAERGGIIGFYVEENRIRFKINADLAKETGLLISSKLLRLARIVD